MKKVILASLVAIPFLIGCSFSKKDGSIKNEIPHTDDLFEKVKTSSVPSLRNDLSKISTVQLNSLRKDGKSLLDFAFERGSSDVIVELINAGLSPFMPNQSGNSLYLQLENSGEINLPYSNLNRLIKEKSLGRILKTLDFEDGQQLSSDVNTFTSPCDMTLLQLIQIPNKLRKIGVEDFLTTTSTTCHFSLQKNIASQVFNRAFLIYLKKSDDVTTQELVALYKALPNDAVYLDVGGRCRIHVSLVSNFILQEIEQAPKKLDSFLNTIESQTDKNANAFMCNFRSWERSISIRDAQRDITQVLLPMADKIKDKFYPRKEDHE